MNRTIIEVFIFGFMLGVFVSQLATPELTGNNALNDVKAEQIAKTPEIILDFGDLKSTPAPEETPLRITCIIITQPQQYKDSFVFVNQTWAQRCNHFAFYSHVVPYLKYNNTVGAIEFKLTDLRLNSMPKTMKAFEHAWNFYGDDTDWFFFSDDRNHVIIENLKYFLKNFSTEEPIAIGNLLHKDNVTYCSGLPGMAINKNAMKLTVERGFRENACPIVAGWSYDFAIGKCMGNVGVKLLEDTNQEGKRHFFPYQPDKHIFLTSKRADDFEAEFRADNFTHKSIILSDYPVSFRYNVGGRAMLLTEYFAYHARPYGLNKI